MSTFWRFCDDGPLTVQCLGKLLHGGSARPERYTTYYIALRLRLFQTPWWEDAEATLTTWCLFPSEAPARWLQYHSVFNFGKGIFDESSGKHALIYGGSAWFARIVDYYSLPAIPQNPPKGPLLNSYANRMIINPYQ